MKAANAAIEKTRAKRVAATEAKAAAVKKATAKPKAKAPTAKASGTKASGARVEKVKAAAEKKKLAAETKAKVKAEREKVRAEKLKAAAAKKNAREKARAEAKAKKAADLDKRHRASMAKAQEREQKRQALQNARAQRQAAKDTKRAAPGANSLATPGAKTRQLQTAFDSRSGEHVRESLGEHIETALPGLKSRDAEIGGGALRVHPDAAWHAGSNASALAIHDWNGNTHTKESVYAQAQGASKLLNEGVLRQGKLSAPPPNSQLGAAEASKLSGLHVLIHEELHGMSRSSPASYQRYGKVLEEVGVELSARHATRHLLSAEVAKLEAFQLRFSHSAFFGSYRNQINDVIDTVSSHTKLSPEAAAQRIVEAHVAATHSSFKTKFRSPEEHLHAFVNGLRVTPSQADKIRADIAQMEL